MKMIRGHLNKITNSIKAIFTISLTFCIVIAFHSCGFLPLKNDFFSIKEYKNLGSIEDFDPIPIYEKLLKYDIETVNKNILNAMRYSLDMLNSSFQANVIGFDATFRMVFLRLFWFRVLFNKDKIDIKPELNLIKKYVSGFDWFTLNISSGLLTNFYTGEYFKTNNSVKSFYLFENVIDKTYKQFNHFDFDKIAENLAKEFVKECPNIIPPYYFLIHIYAHSKKCSDVNKYYRKLSKYLTPNNEESKLYTTESLHFESIISYTKDFKQYISQFCDLEDSKK